VKRLSVQLHLDRLDAPAAASSFVKILALKPGVSLLNEETGNDNGPFLTATYSAEDEVRFGDEIKASLQFAGWLGGAIVVCEGKSGWDDYILVHSFNEGNK
jgi:hypothetical protein